MIVRLAHNQKVGGLIPSPATNLWTCRVAPGAPVHCGVPTVKLTVASLKQTGASTNLHVREEPQDTPARPLKGREQRPEVPI